MGMENKPMSNDRGLSQRRLGVRGTAPAFGMASSLGLTAGLIMIGGLVLWSGIGQIAAILATAGAGLLLIAILAPPEALAMSEAWRQLFPAERKPAFWRAFCASWMGMAVNTLLPVATIGGEVVKARVLVLSGAPLNDTAAATLVDKTVQAIATLIWGLVGLFVLASLRPDEGILHGGLIAAALLTLGIGGFIAVQWRGGFSLLARFSQAASKHLGDHDPASIGKGLDLAVRAIYRRPVALLRSLGLRLIGQVWLVSEVLLTTWLLGLAIGFAEALMLRALIGAVRGLSFVMPAGLGLQEGAYVALGALIGLQADMMLALSLASRLREILPSLPGILLWQHVEGRRLWRQHTAGKAAPAGNMPSAG